MSSRRFNDAFRRLTDAEARFLDSEFLAPALPGGAVGVRIAGVACRLRIDPPDFEGWGVFRPASHTRARLVRAAGLGERRQYLGLFPMVRMVLCRRGESGWLALPAHRGDRRFRIDGAAAVLLVDEAEQFEVVRTRFDGTHFWFEAVDPRWDPAAAAYLREALHRVVAPGELDRPGLTPEERAAYAANYRLTEGARRQAEAARPEGRIRDALAHAGAELVDYLERGDGYRVTYQIDGRRHVSAVDKGDLAVQVAGICLSGQDRRFDLHSLVGVIREAERGGGIVRVGGDGMEEEDYWDVHPPDRR